jgi:hypothetical protein
MIHDQLLIMVIPKSNELLEKDNSKRHRLVSYEKG